MITDIPVSNIFVARNNWHLKAMQCRKCSQQTYTEYQLEKIMNDVIQKTMVSKEEFISKVRKRDLVEARQMYFKRARDMTKASLEQIGSMVTTGDHANVMHGIKQVNTIPSLKRKYDEIFNGLKPIVNNGDSIVEKTSRPELTPTKVHLSLTGKPTY